MTLLSRALQSLTTHKVRTLGVAVIVSLTLGMFLVLDQVASSVSANAAQAVNSAPSVVVVQPAGGSIAAGTGPMMPDSAVNTVSRTPHVASVQRFLVGPPLGVSITPTPVAGGCDGAPAQSNGNLVLAEDTTSPLALVGATLAGASSLTITAGRTLGTGDEHGTLVLIGQQYAHDNGLQLGSPLTVDGQSYTVAGIFAGTDCAGSVIVLPYPTAASAAGAGTGPRLLYAYADSFDSLNPLVNSLQGQLGLGYSVLSLANANHEALQASVSSIIDSTRASEYVILGVGAVVMMTVMVLTISHRTREIGLMKALGFTNRRILGQISLESILLSLLGLPLGLGLPVAFGPVISQWVVGGSGGNGGEILLGNVQYAASFDLLLVGIGVTVGFGLLGAAYPSVRALLLRPTEALRSE